jgi:hypothetical protein
MKKKSNVCRFGSGKWFWLVKGAAQYALAEQKRV